MFNSVEFYNLEVFDVVKFYIKKIIYLVVIVLKTK